MRNSNRHCEANLNSISKTSLVPEDSQSHSLVLHRPLSTPTSDKFSRDQNSKVQFYNSITSVAKTYFEKLLVSSPLSTVLISHTACTFQGYHLKLKRIYFAFISLFKRAFNLLLIHFAESEYANIPQHRIIEP